ncbi:MAG: HAD family hydrolase [Thomasclavelia sp.]|nr:HAD family hydrolase [Thomasclavelia sp.]
MTIKAIMCDVDGTLLSNEQIVTPETVEAIKKVKEKGIIFGCCTGRDPQSVDDALEKWGIKGLVDIIVGSGGSEIKDYILDTMEEEYPLEGSLIKQVMKHFEDMDVNFAIPYRGIIYAPKDDELIQNLSVADGIPYKVVDFDEFLKEPKPKVMIVCTEENMPKVVERGKTFSNDKYKSASLKTCEILYEYMDPRVTKTHGLETILAKHNISMEELCTFGDADNDYDMTQNAGVGVVMANGSKLTKSVADYITDDNNHDGIANFINNHIL